MSNMQDPQKFYKLIPSERISPGAWRRIEDFVYGGGDFGVLVHVSKRTAGLVRRQFASMEGFETTSLADYPQEILKIVYTGERTHVSYRRKRVNNFVDVAKRKAVLGISTMLDKDGLLVMDDV